MDHFEGDGWRENLSWYIVGISGYVALWIDYAVAI